MSADLEFRLLTRGLNLLGRLPLAVSRGLGRTIGLAADFLGTTEAATTHTNLALCMPQLSLAERRRMARRSLGATGALAMELGLAWTRPVQQALAHVDPGPEVARLHQSRRTDQGLLLLVPHLGNWEMLNLWLQASLPPGQHFTALYDPLRNQALDAWVRQRRMRNGANLVPASRRGVRSLMHTLAAGGVVGILPDQVPPRPGGVHAPFFGRGARTMTLVQRLLQRTDARALAAVALRRRGGFTLRFLEPCPGLAAEDDLVAAAALNATVERCVMLAPQQYQWDYKRFKHPREGTLDYYKKRAGK